jgi:hypothetical protein
MADDIDRAIELGDTSGSFIYFSVKCPLCHEDWHGLPRALAFGECPGEWGEK